VLWLTSRSWLSQTKRFALQWRNLSTSLIGLSGDARHEPGARPREMSFSSLAWKRRVKNQEVNCAKFWNSDRFAVKICKQCLQTASASGRLRSPDLLPSFRPWTPWVLAPKWKFLASLLVRGLTSRCGVTRWMLTGV